MKAAGAELRGGAVEGAVEGSGWERGKGDMQSSELNDTN